MRIEIKPQWNGFEHDGMLYCAQRIEEMLMAYTSHLYKTPVYNTFLLAYEYMEVYSLVEAKKIDQAHLKNVIDEFIHTFSSDVVIKDHFSSDQIKYYVGRLTGNSLREQQNTMNYLIHKISGYPEWCEETLKRTIGYPKKKKEIELALKSYIPMLIGIGYRPYYIYQQCKSFFTNTRVSGISDIDNFFKLFSRIERDYIVYFPVKKQVNKFKSILEERLNISFEEDDNSNKLRYDKGNQICIHKGISALDPYVAAHEAYLSFDLFLRFYRFLGNRDKEWIGNKCLVCNEKGNSWITHFGSEQYSYSKDYDDKTLGRNSERIITDLLENTGHNDYFRIDKIIRAHNSALLSPDINNAFLNFWSVLEIISVDEFNDDVSKIRQVIDKIIPVLKRNYVMAIIEELHDYLKCNLTPDQYSSLMQSIVETGSDHYKIACMVSLPEYDKVRRNVYEMLKDYPLIRSRISQLYEDVFRKKKLFVSELNRYGQRLVWHIQRLYRVRNSIIHSGETNENMVSLVEHLHSYVDVVGFEIIRRMTQKNSLATVNNVLLDAQIYVDDLNKNYSKDEPFIAKDIRMLIQ